MLPPRRGDEQQRCRMHYRPEEGDLTFILLSPLAAPCARLALCLQLAQPRQSNESQTAGPDHVLAHVGRGTMRGDVKLQKPSLYATGSGVFVIAYCVHELFTHQPMFLFYVVWNLINNININRFAPLRLCSSTGG